MKQVELVCRLKATPPFYRFLILKYSSGPEKPPGLSINGPLELVQDSKWNTIFRLDFPVGNFGLPLKTFRLFWKFFGRANQNGSTVYSPTEISFFFVNGKHSTCRQFENHLPQRNWSP